MCQSVYHYVIIISTRRVQEEFTPQCVKTSHLLPQFWSRGISVNNIRYHPNGSNFDASIYINVIAMYNNATQQLLEQLQ
ncbi:hypothetical protein SK128_009780 [Halocaridina rubra]|uniref:Uncharacterized protein n=1 Tax=Halocaridina rubra TaxID=373956 RepID=A0AAN8ZSB8_HALRR